MDTSNPRVVRLVARAAQIFQSEPTLWGQRELINLVWSLSKMRFRPEDSFHNRVADYIRDHCSVISLNTLSILVHSFATMRALTTGNGPQWYLRMAIHIDKRIREPDDLIPLKLTPQRYY